MGSLDWIGKVGSWVFFNGFLFVFMFFIFYRYLFSYMFLWLYFLHTFKLLCMDLYWLGIFCACFLSPILYNTLWKIIFYFISFYFYFKNRAEYIMELRRDLKQGCKMNVIFVGDQRWLIYHFPWRLHHFWRVYELLYLLSLIRNYFRNCCG